MFAHLMKIVIGVPGYLYSILCEGLVVGSPSCFSFQRNMLSQDKRNFIMPVKCLLHENTQVHPLPLFFLAHASPLAIYSLSALLVFSAKSNNGLFLLTLACRQVLLFRSLCYQKIAHSLPYLGSKQSSQVAAVAYFCC